MRHDNISIILKSKSPGDDDLIIVYFLIVVTVFHPGLLIDYVTSDVVCEDDTIFGIRLIFIVDSLDIVRAEYVS